MHKKILLAFLLLGCLLIGAESSTTGLAVQNLADPNILYLPLITNPIQPLWIGPDGGSIVCLTISSSNPQVIYAGTWGAGVFKSVDGGGTWEAFNAGLPNLLINAIAVDPLNPDVVYAGPYRAKLYKSMDGGQSWMPAYKGIQPEAIVYAIAIDPVEPNRVYITTRGISNNGGAPWNGVVYRSDDSGASWKVILFNIGGPEAQDWAYDVAVHPNSPNLVLVAQHQRGGVYRSTNYGEDFVPVNDGFTDLSGRAIVINPLTLNPSTLYYGVWHTKGTFKSFNTGDTWQEYNNGSYQAMIIRMAIDPLTPDTVYAATWNNRGILKTINGGLNWNSVGGLTLDQLYIVQVNPQNPNIVFVGTNGDGLYWSTNAGAHWGHHQSGILNTSVNTILIQPDANKSMYISINGGGISRKTAPDQSWQDFNQNLPEKNINALVRNSGNPNLIYAITNSSGIYRTDVSNSLGWIKIDFDLPPGSAENTPLYSPDHPFATREDLEAEVEIGPGGIYGSSLPLTVSDNAPLLAMAFAPSNPSIAYVGVSSVNTPYSGVYVSHDGGVHWSATPLWSHAAWDLAVSPVDPNEVYAATSSPGVVYYSTNGGLGWESTSLPPWGIYSLVIPPTNPKLVYAGTNDGVYRRQNGGPWIFSGLSGFAVSVLAAHPDNPNYILAGTNRGAYQSIDQGQTWEPVDPALAGRVIQSIAYDPLDPRYVYFGTKTHGAVRVYLP